MLLKSKQKMDLIENNQKTILNISHKYYENLYKETKVKDKDILNKFLEQIQN